MSKYKIFKNKVTKYHPCIEVQITIDGRWENIEITSSPTQNNKYSKFDVNPNPNWAGKSAWFRRYIRKDPIRAKGKELKNYKIIESDEIKINAFIDANKKNKSSRKKKSWKKRKHG